MPRTRLQAVLQSVQQQGQGDAKTRQLQQALKEAQQDLAGARTRADSAAARRRIEIVRSRLGGGTAGKVATPRPGPATLAPAARPDTTRRAAPTLNDLVRERMDAERELGIQRGRSPRDTTRTKGGR